MSGQVDEIRETLIDAQMKLRDGDLFGALEIQHGAFLRMLELLDVQTTTVTEGATTDVPEDQTRWTDG